MSNFKAGKKLGQISLPADLRNKFSEKDLPQICDELRQYIVDVVSQKGGHLALA